jgi:tetratricopeptide (TPR) repeat protein
MATPSFPQAPPMPNLPQQQQQPPRTFVSATPRIYNTPVSPNKSLDAMADAFLSTDSSHHSSSSGTGAANNNSDSTGLLDNPNLRPLSLPTTTTELERVRALVARRAWGDVLSVVHTLLKGATSHYTPLYAGCLLQGVTEAVDSLDSHRADVVELLTLQAHGWLKMRRYPELGHELRQYHKVQQQESSSVPTWIPASVWILLAAAWQYIPVDLGGGAAVALDALMGLRPQLVAAADPGDLLQLEYQLANVTCRQQQWRTALQALDRLLAIVPAAVQAYVRTHYADAASDATTRDNLQSVLEAVVRCEVWSRQGRIFLQTGALEAAQKLFHQAKEEWKRVTATTTMPEALAQHPWVTQQVPAQVYSTNTGLLAFSYRQYDQASEDFRQALNLMQPASWSVDGSYQREDWVGTGLLPPQRKESLYAETMNDLAIAALYSVCCRIVVWMIHTHSHLTHFFSLTCSAVLESTPLVNPFSAACMIPFK